jgi:broad specificity phosphatase PhoE
MLPKTIILVRHAESEGNVDHTVYSHTPDYAVKLTEKGREQAKEAGRELSKVKGGFTAYVSPYFRTRKTYELIKQSLGDRVKREQEDILLREQEWSRGIGKHTNIELEKEQLNLSLLYYRFPEGESNCDCYIRATLFIDSMYRDFQLEGCPENVLIVTHGMFMRVFLMKMLKLSVEDFERIKNPKNCESIFLDLQEDNSYKLRAPLRMRDSVSHKFKYECE